MKRLILIAALMLPACTTTKYVTRACVAPGAQIPAEPPQVGSELTGNAERDFQIVAGSAARLRAWGRSLNLIVESCKG